ncbi:MAG: phytoene/squalene synthase family protein [Candidatus Obscuribacterales bacterium]|nr:phytoene/squalene synthase family protein [Candidatus Obscuribacterales bacterium]
MIVSDSVFTRAQLRVCRDVIYRNSQSFFLSSLLLPPDVRACAWAIYGFCRIADDLIDGQPDRGDLHQSLSRLHSRLDEVYSGRPRTLLDSAFASFVEHYALPRSIPDCLLDGFATDVNGVEFADERQLIEYSFKVASTVGLMIVYAMEPELKADRKLVLTRACDLGIAMQLTNIARDMGADLKNGRVYFPLSWTLRHGFDLDSVKGGSPRFSQAEALIARDLIAFSDRHYASAVEGIELLPSRCRPAITAALYVYSAINGRIKTNEYDSISSRAVVPLSSKLAMVLKAYLKHAPANSRPTSFDSGPSDEIIERFLFRLGLLNSGLVSGRSPCGI